MGFRLWYTEYNSGMIEGLFHVDEAAAFAYGQLKANQTGKPVVITPVDYHDITPQIIAQMLNTNEDVAGHWQYDDNVVIEPNEQG
jgi:hypothetical protein